MINYCNNIDELKALLIRESKIVLCCYSDWCPACSSMKPTFEQLSRQYDSKICFGKIILDESPELSMALGISAIPTFLFIKENQLVERFSGAVGRRLLLQAIASSFGRK